MIRCLALALLLVAVGHGAFAQPATFRPWTLGTPVVAGGGCTGGYQGSGDAASGAVRYYSLRGYNCAYSTGANNALTVRRADNNSTYPVVILNTGSLDVANASANCAGTTCFVSTLNDQVGTANLVQATAANQPQLVFSCKGSLPCLQYNGNSMTMSGTIGSISPPLSYSLVANVLGDNGSINTEVLASAGTVSINANVQRNTGNDWLIATDGNATAGQSATDATWHSGQFVFSTTVNASVLNIDGTETTGDTAGSAGGYTTAGTSGFAAISNYYMNGYQGEWRIDTTAWSSGTRTALCHNTRLYWSTPGTC